MAKINKAREDYLRVIYELHNALSVKRGVRSIDIARKLKISKASVSEMLRKLATENLIKIEPYSKIFLTAKGKRRAEMFYSKYYVIKSFLKKILKCKEERAEEEAHELEHALSDESVEMIKKLINGDEGELRNLPSYIG